MIAKKSKICQRCYGVTKTELGIYVDGHHAFFGVFFDEDDEQVKKSEEVELLIDKIVVKLNSCDDTHDRFGYGDR